MRSNLFFLLLFLCSYAAYAGNGKTKNDDRSEKHIPVSLEIKLLDPMGDQSVLRIPLKRAGRLFLLEAKIDGVEGNLIFDTGASGLVVNKTYFRNYVGSNKYSGSVTGALTEVRSCVMDSVVISGLCYENVVADITNLGHIEDRRGVKILGLMGLTLIDMFEIVFDSRNDVLILYKLDRDGNCVEKETGEMNYKYRQEIDLTNNMMTIRGVIGEREICFCLDTGAEISLIHSGLPKKVLNTIAIQRSSDIGGASSNRVSAIFGEMQGLLLAGCDMGKMPAAIINLSNMSSAYGCSIDGMLGYDFWQKGVFRINFRKKEFSFNLLEEMSL